MDWFPLPIDLSTDFCPPQHTVQIRTLIQHSFSVVEEQSLICTRAINSLESTDRHTEHGCLVVYFVLKSAAVITTSVQFMIEELHKPFCARIETSDC